mgnify:CR=1 FL=1
MRLKSALRRGVAAAVIAGIVVSSGIPAYAKTWNIADGDITVKGASDESGNYNNVKQGEKDFEKDEGETVITGESDKNTVTIDTSEGNVDVTFDDLKIDVSGKKEGDVSGDSPVDAGKAAVTVQGDHDAAIELDGANELKSGSCNAGLEKNGHESSGKLTIKDDKGKDGSLTAEGGDGGGEAVGVFFDQFRHFIVGEAAQIHGDFGRGDGFHRGGRQRKHLHVAFHAVHEPETGVEVEQCGDRFGVPGQVGTHVAVGHLLFEDGLILLGQDVVEGVDIQHGRLLTCRGCCWRCRACSAGSAA